MCGLGTIPGLDWITVTLWAVFTAIVVRGYLAEAVEAAGAEMRSAVAGLQYHGIGE